MKREIACEDWDEFVQKFSRRHRGRRARIEVTAPLGEGGPLADEYESLRSVSLMRSSGGPEIVLELGEGEGERLRFSYAVTDPARLWLEEGPHGIDTGLGISSVEQDETLLAFEPIEPLLSRGRVAVGLGSHRSEHRFRPGRL